jgi:hypothetical protein
MPERALALTVCAVLLVVAGSARADGVVEVRGAYYKERSTRVEQPMIDAAFDAGPHGRVEGHFLVDSITSASAAAGAPPGVQFTERRYEGGLGYTQELPGHVKVGVQGKYSSESDYFSKWIAAHGEIALLDQNTTLRVLVGHAFDTITNGIAAEMSAFTTPMREYALDTTLGSLTVSQLLTPQLVASLTYDLMYLKGYQANVYRVVPGGVQPVAERVPDVRVRHAIAAALRTFIPQTRTTAVASYRLYIDDWGIVAHTPELRVVQPIVDGLDLRVRYRYHVQSQANFYKVVYSQAELDDMSTYVTEDEKLSAFTTHTLGAQLSVALRDFGFVGGFGDTRLDLIAEHIWQSTSFGDAWVGELGFSVPFSY